MRFCRLACATTAQGWRVLCYSSHGARGSNSPRTWACRSDLLNQEEAAGVAPWHFRVESISSTAGPARAPQEAQTPPPPPPPGPCLELQEFPAGPDEANMQAPWPTAELGLSTQLRSQPATGGSIWMSSPSEPSGDCSPGHPTCRRKALRMRPTQLNPHKCASSQQTT